MRLITRMWLATLLTALATALPGAAWAQQQGSIAGLVTDASGAVLPGATVEASSPALIEQARAVVTDGTGQYRIVDLRPGVYSVTVTLPGFSTARRDGIELTVGFTATVNAELRVGSVEETVTVTGASPLVDIQNVNQIRVITRDVIENIPTGRGFANFVALIPGVTMSNSSLNISQDVGGGTGYNFAFAAIHGGKAMDQQVMVNGMSVTSLTGTGGTRTNWSDGATQEYGLQLAAHSAEIAYGGIFANVLPKEGGNRFTGQVFANFATEDLQADNLDDALRARGLGVVNNTKKLVDFSPTFGGPLRTDKLWFYTSFRAAVTETYVGGLFYNQTPAGWLYTPDPARPAVNDQKTYSTTLNLTYQMARDHRLSLFGSYEKMCLCHFSISPTVAPEAATYNPGDSSIVQSRYTATLTSRLLIEAGASHYLSSFPRRPQSDATEPSILEQSTNLRFRSGATYFPTPQTVDDYRASLSYVTGANSLKTGVTYQWQYAKDPTVFAIGDVNYRTLNGIPNQVTYYTTPYAAPLYLAPLGAYVQDQLKFRKLTVNAGLRFDQFRSSYDAIHLEPVRWLPVARDYPGAEVLSWQDLSPRLGLAYDVFGTGRTALKFSLSRYVLQEGKNNTNNVHPVISATNSVVRTWTDGNNDRVVQGDPLNPATNGELGPSPNNNFGKPNTTLRYDPDWSRGFNARPYNWETLVTLQHELLPRVGVEVSYNRRTYGNFIVNDNTLVGPADYDPFCINAPVDARLPGGGGERICGLFDLNPAKVGLVDTLRTFSGKYGNQKEHWNGVDVSANVRLPNGAFIQGGASAGRQMMDNCDVVTKIDNPSTHNCHRESALLPQVKLLGTYPLPWWGLTVSGTFQSSVPDPVGGANFDYNYFGLPANYVAGNAQVQPSLGRTLASAANVTVNVVEPGTLYPERTHQLDLRAAKTFVIGPSRLQVMLDLYNVLNANSVLRQNGAYGTDGAAWGRPQAIIPGRLVKFGGQFSF
jgi:hypothetical protein